MKKQEQTYKIGYWTYTSDGYDFNVIEVIEDCKKKAINKAKLLTSRFSKDYHVLYKVVIKNTFKFSKKWGKLFDPNPKSDTLIECVKKEHAENFMNEWNEKNASNYPLGKKAYLELY